MRRSRSTSVHHMDAGTAHATYLNGIAPVPADCACFKHVPNFPNANLMNCGGFFCASCCCQHGNAFKSVTLARVRSKMPIIAKSTARAGCEFSSPPIPFRFNSIHKCIQYVFGVVFAARTKQYQGMETLLSTIVPRPSCSAIGRL